MGDSAAAVPTAASAGMASDMYEAEYRLNESAAAAAYDVNGSWHDNCSSCFDNDLCLPDEEYQAYLSWVSVDTYEMVLISLILVVFLTGVLGNSLVVIAVTTTKSMQSVTNIFIVNLALADILVMLFCAPPSIIWDVTNTWIFGSLMCRIVIYIQDISVSVSVLTLTFIAYDRYHAICRPLEFSSRKRKAAWIAAIWSISALIGIPNAAMLELTYPLEAILTPCAKTENITFDLARCSPSWSEDVDFGVLLIKAVLLYTLPLVFMSIAYFHIVRTLWKRNNMPGSSAQDNSHREQQHNGQSERKSNSSSQIALLSRNSTMLRSCRTSTGMTADNGKTVSSAPNRALDNQLKTRRKVAKMLIAVVAMFSINYFPVWALPIINYIVNQTMDKESEAYDKLNNVFMYAGIITHCMCYFNSAINPIIYYFMSAQFKAQYRRILSCRCMTADAPSPRTAQTRTLLHHDNHTMRSRAAAAANGKGESVADVTEVSTGPSPLHLGKRESATRRVLRVTTTSSSRGIREKSSVDRLEVPQM